MKRLLTLAYTLLCFSLVGQRLTIVYDNWYPYCYEDEGIAKGIDVDVIKLLLGTIQGYDLEFVRDDWEYCIPGVVDGRYDAVLTVMKSKERARLMKYPKMYLSYAQSKFYVLEKKDTYSLLGLVAGYEYTEVVNKNKIKKMYFRSPDDLMNAFFITGEVDIIYEDNLYIAGESKKYGIDVHSVDKYMSNSEVFNESKPDLLYIAFNKNVPDSVISKLSRDIKSIRNTLVYRNILSRYTTYRLYRNVLSANNFYIPMLIISFIGIAILILAYSTVSYNHFNFQSLLFILLGAVVVSLGDIVSVLADYIFYVKIIGMLILSYGIYKVMQKYWNTMYTAGLYVVTTGVGFSIAYFTNSISLVYYTVSLLGFYLLMHNFYKDGIHKNVLINVANSFYIIFSIIVGLSRQDFMPYSNIYAVFFGLGYFLQLMSSLRRNL